MKKNAMLGLLALIFLLVASNGSAAPLIDQTDNLLLNGSFETGSFDPVTGHSIPSAADNWRQWSNSGTDLTTELLTEDEMLRPFRGRHFGWQCGISHHHWRFQ